MRVALDVLDSILQRGPVTAVEVPATSVVPPRTMRVASRATVIAEELREEATRLETQVRRCQKVATETVLPLVRRGWRVAREGDAWLVDYGLAQLFHPLLPGVVERKAGMELDAAGGMVNAKEEWQTLMIDGVPFGSPVTSDDEIERVLFRHQWELLSVAIFALLQRQRRLRADLIYEEVDVLDFYVARVGWAKDRRVHVELQPTTSAVVSQWRPSFARLLEAYLKGHPESLIECVLSMA